MCVRCGRLLHVFYELMSVLPLWGLVAFSLCQLSFGLFTGAIQPFLNLHKNVTEVQLMIPPSVKECYLGIWSCGLAWHDFQVHWPPLCVRALKESESKEALKKKKKTVKNVVQNKTICFLCFKRQACFLKFWWRPLLPFWFDKCQNNGNIWACSPYVVTCAINIMIYF